MKVFFVCTDKVSPVIYSQVIETVQGLRKEGIDTEVLFLLPYRSYKKRQASLIELNNSGIPYQIKMLPLQKTIIGQFISLLYFSVISIKNRGNKVIIHSRGLRASFFAINAKCYFQNLLVLYDVRGDYLVEREFHDASLSEIKKIEKQELIALSSTNHVLYVSEHLRDVLTNRYNHPTNNGDVIPCTATREKIVFNNNDRQIVRKKIGIDNKLVFIYSGSIGKWHCFDKIISLCEALSISHDNAAFLFLTRQKEEASMLVENSLIANKSYIMEVQPEEIGKYLSASDVAMILRENNPLNASASPVKIAEYILNGLPLIMTDTINDYSIMIRKSKLGLVLSSEDLNVSDRLMKKLDGISSKEWLGQRNKYNQDETFVLTKSYQVTKLKNIYQEMIT